MAGSKKQLGIGAVLIALVVMMIAGQAMAATVVRGGSVLRPGGGIGQGLPEWFSLQITRGVARNGKPLPIEYRQRAGAVDAKVGWFRLGR